MKSSLFEASGCQTWQEQKICFDFKTARKCVLALCLHLYYHHHRPSLRMGISRAAGTNSSSDICRKNKALSVPMLLKLKSSDKAPKPLTLTVSCAWRALKWTPCPRSTVHHVAAYQEPHHYYRAAERAYSASHCLKARAFGVRA